MRGEAAGEVLGSPVPKPFKDPFLLPAVPLRGVAAPLKSFPRGANPIYSAMRSGCGDRSNFAGYRRLNTRFRLHIAILLI